MENDEFQKIVADNGYKLAKDNGRMSVYRMSVEKKDLEKID